MIKNIEDLKNIQIVCRNQEQVKNCLNYLKQLGFDVEDFTNCCNGYCIVYWGEFSEKFVSYYILKTTLPIEFYNKELVKTLQKFIKEKEKQEKVKDFEVAEDKRITKINNWESKKCLYFIGAWDYGTINFDDFKREGFEYYINLGLAYETKEARDKAMFKLEIETKLKNIAERLNAGRKIDWEDDTQIKYCIFFDFKNDYLNYWDYGHSKDIGQIHCLNKNFLEVAKQEIGVDNLIKYFK